MKYILAYDIGTTNVKACVFRVGKASGEAADHSGPQFIEMVASASEGYGLYTFPDGGAEQHTDEWWEAMCRSTRQLAGDAPDIVKKIDGISFCSQMQGLVLVDQDGAPVRHPMSYMDQRAADQMKRGIGSGLKVSGMNARRLLKSLKITGAVSGSVKDPMWKYLWVKEKEPENFSRVCWWLDVKEALIARMTGRCVMTEDSAYATMLYDTREGKRGWSEEMARMFGVDIDHLPEIIGTAEAAGSLRPRQAEELGLTAGIPVFGGGGDASLIGIGTGCVRPGDTHIYCGTSGWVSTIVEKQTVDTNAMIASIIGAQEDLFNYFAEMETAGKCLEWVKEHLALDEVGIYKETVSDDLLAYLSEVVEKAQPGAGGVVFTPWLHGNRCPFEDPAATGMFFGLTLDTGKTEMIRAVYEGVCYHLKWMLECQDKKIHTSDRIRFCGGVARSSTTAQILADITGRRIEVVDSPQNVGSVGAALTAGVGLGIIDDMEAIADVIPVVKSFEPRPEHAAVYQRNYKVFKRLHGANRSLFRQIRGERRGTI